MMQEIPLNPLEALLTLQTYIHSMSSLDDLHGFFTKPDWVRREARPVRAWEARGMGCKAKIYLFEFSEPRQVGRTLQTGYALASGTTCIPYHWFGGDGTDAALLAAEGAIEHGC